MLMKILLICYIYLLQYLPLRVQCSSLGLDMLSRYLVMPHIILIVYRCLISLSYRLLHSPPSNPHPGLSRVFLDTVQAWPPLATRHSDKSFREPFCHCLVLRKTHNTYLMQIKADRRVLAVSRIQDITNNNC